MLTSCIACKDFSILKKWLRHYDSQAALIAKICNSQDKSTEGSQLADCDCKTKALKAVTMSWQWMNILCVTVYWDMKSFFCLCFCQQYMYRCLIVCDFLFFSRLWRSVQSLYFSFALSCVHLYAWPISSQGPLGYRKELATPATRRSLHAFRSPQFTRCLPNFGADNRFSQRQLFFPVQISFLLSLEHNEFGFI